VLPGKGFSNYQQLMKCSSLGKDLEPWGLQYWNSEKLLNWFHTFLSGSFAKVFPSTRLNVFGLTLHVFISVITKLWCHTLSLKFSIKCFARPWGLYSAVQILASTTQVFFPNLRSLAFSLPKPQAIVDTAYYTATACTIMKNCLKTIVYPSMRLLIAQQNCIWIHYSYLL
jgi:hypothetical protein